MRQAFARADPGVPVIGGAAGAIPLRDGTLDAAAVGTAFHWVDGREGHVGREGLVGRERKGST